MQNNIDERFEAVHAKHPEIYEKIKETVWALMRRGYTHYSMDGCMHIVRFTSGASASDMDKYKLNNDFTSRYARMFIRDYPQHSNFFRTRELKKAA